MGKHRAPRPVRWSPAHTVSAARAGATWVVVPVLLASVGVALGTSTASAAKAPRDACQVATGGGAWRPPLTQEFTISSRFGERFHPIDKVTKMHAGTDLVSRPGRGKVVAAAAGTVVRAGVYGGLGNAVVLRHPGGVTSTYGHLARIDADVRPGEKVRIGEVLGLEGSTGKSTGDHLHFEIRVQGVPTDPVPFMRQHQAPLNGDLAGDTAVAAGSRLPAAGVPRKHTVHTNAMPVPAKTLRLYQQAAQAYDVPWTLLAGIGMEETLHGRVDATSSAGARGLMQFLPSTWELMGVDGDGDGKAEIDNDADSIMSAANYLTRSGVRKGQAGVRRALFAYNHADWYVNDVLAYAQTYGGGTLSCVPGEADSLSSEVPKQVEPTLRWAEQHVGDSHQLGAAGPRTWDASSYVQRAYRQVRVYLPRTAAGQRDWLADGHGTRVQPGQERPGDLIFTDSYRGPKEVGDVALVLDPVEKTTLEAKDPASGVITGSYAQTETESHIFEIWRPEVPRKHHRR